MIESSLTVPLGLSTVRLENSDLDRFLLHHRSLTINIFRTGVEAVQIQLTLYLFGRNEQYNSGGVIGDTVQFMERLWLRFEWVSNDKCALTFVYDETM